MAATVDQKLLRQTKFPPEFSQKVDMKKINVEVMKRWIAGKITEILKSDDDIVIELCFNLLEGSRFPDIKALQISLTGFLDKDAPKFCKELWNLCLSAQSNPQGIPKELLEAKKMELLQEKVDAEKTAQETQRRQDGEKAREQEVHNMRQRDRTERSERGRGRGGGRGGRAGFESRRFRDSTSPAPRRRSPHRGPPPRREVDTYIPNARGGHRANGRGRSPTRSASRSPPTRKRRNSSSSRSSSLEKSPPRRRQQSYSPTRRAGKPDHLRSRSSSSNSSHAHSPRRKNIRRNQSGSSSRSRSPPRKQRRRRGNSSSRSRSSTPQNRRNHARIRRRSSSGISDGELDRRDVLKTRPKRDAARLSPPVESQNDSQSSRSRSRSRSRTRQRKDPKRRRSVQRWEPTGRRPRETPTSSPDAKRQRTATEDVEVIDADRVMEGY